MKIGIIRERKNPPDSRVALTPAQCAALTKQYNVQLVVEPSPDRCFKDKEYSDHNIELSNDLSDCAVLIGVKEVPIENLIPEKTYFFFSHTIKQQIYNRKLLQSILKKSIKLIDYEVLCNDAGQRLIAFGKFAGMVGAHNALWTWSQRTGSFALPRMKDCYDYQAAKKVYKTVSFPKVRIVLTGDGRVGNGAALVLQDMGIRKVTPESFLQDTFDEAVFTQLSCKDYVRRKDGTPYADKDFFGQPELFESSFQQYTYKSDIMINGIYWDNNAPAFFSLSDMTHPNFNIRVIADVTCDIAPVSSIPSTIKASTIADPVFGFDPATGKECPAFTSSGIDMMTIDNLPNEMPRDASQAFGEQFMEHIITELLQENSSNVIAMATVAANGKLGGHFGYLEDYVKGGIEQELIDL